MMGLSRLKSANNLTFTPTQYHWLIGLFVLSFGLRVWASQVPINVDEALWMHRGLLFFKSLFEFNWSETYLRHHPGVPNMWLSGSSVITYCLIQKGLSIVGFGDTSSVIDCLSIRPFPVNFYVAARIMQALVTSGCMVGIYLLSRCLLGHSLALIGVCALTLEPFFLAYQRLITTDALQTCFSMLAWLSLLVYLRGNGDRRLLIVSGVSLGLAVSSKIPTLFAIPAIAIWIVLIELKYWQPVFQPRGWQRHIIDSCVWLGVAIATFFLIWPALWVAPLETLQRLWAGIIEEGGGSNQVFWGQLTDSPGVLFYPIVLAYRLSPALLLGTLGGAIALFVPKVRRMLPMKIELVAIALIPLVTLLVLSLSSTKMDRYIVPIMPEVALFSGLGWYLIGLQIKHGLSQGQKRRSARWSSHLASAQWLPAAIAVIAIQLLVFAPAYPYYLTYYDPLLGGSQHAQQTLMIGNGEGLDRAAHWINQTPNASELTVASWYSSVFSSYFKGKTLRIDKTDDLTNQTLWVEANRVVLYINQIQRGFPNSKFLDYFTHQDPLYTVSLNGIDYAWVYPGPRPLPDELSSIQSSQALDDNPYLHLLGYNMTESKTNTRTSMAIALYWSVESSLPDNLAVITELCDRPGNCPVHVESPLMAGYFPANQATIGTVLRDVHWIDLPANLSPGQYALHIRALTRSDPVVSGQSKSEVSATHVEATGTIEILPDDDLIQSISES
jgi:hypothetical protein